MRVEISDLLKKIEDQANKQHFLNALVWTIELQRWLLGCYNDILKARHEDGSDVE